MVADVFGRGPAGWVAVALVVACWAVTAAVARRFSWLGPSGWMVLGVVGLTVVVFGLLAVALPLWWALGATVVLYLVILDRLAGRPDRRRLTRVSRLVPPERGRCLATLPVTVADQRHPPREDAGCTCLAPRMVPGRRAVLVVTTTSVFLQGVERAGEPAPIGEIRDLALVATALSFLRPLRHRFTDVDGLPLPRSGTNQLRLILQDHSSLWLRSRPRHGAYLFLETFRRLAEDTTLRVLLVVADRTSVGFAALRDEVRLPGGLVSSKVARLGDAGMLDVHPGRRFEITPRGFAEISGRLRYNAFATKLFDPEA